MLPFTSTDRQGPGHGASFDALPESAATHFKLCFLAAVLHVLDQLSRNLGSLDEALEQFPFLRDYLDEIERLGGAETPSAEATEEWIGAVRRWEQGVGIHLPLRALREALGLDDGAVTLLFAISLIEEDPRFGFVIECAQPVSPGQHRPTLGLLTAWWRDDDAVTHVRDRVRTLLDSGLIQGINPEAPRLQWVFQSPPAVWDALRGEMRSAPAPWLRFTPADELPSPDELVVAEPLRRAIATVPSLLRSGDARAVIVRGPQHNGRRTIVRAIAGELGRGVLELRGPLRADDERWALACTLDTLAHAMPLIVLDLALGETAGLPRVTACDSPVAVVLGKHGAVTGEAVSGAITLAVDMPGPDERRLLWQRSLAVHEPEDAAALAQRFRMTSGNIRTAAALARPYALLEGRHRVTAGDVRAASRTLHREIETLATYLPASGGWESLGASAETLDELRNLEARCRHREQIHRHVGPALGRQLNCGVRALLAGPSGTGKTLAARLLASTLQMDLYRLDLASVVNKYIGETEKSLNQLFSRAEELDVILLIDEGDALLTQRTAVQSSNDRYANLETNFLLQRLESFEGILLVTTNAANRIDSAFQRRMDVVVELRMPGPQERWLIWQLHLPVDHRIDHAWLREAAVRCTVSGGQIRNAVLHASLLALDQGRPLSTAHVATAIHREYRKTGAVCPLPLAGA
ncbi:MAG TPA: ATP-binding protein [Solirubrobacterales bacterium]|nr:ATP-binding protein [Solirubrobacterales bacterium]